MILIDANLLIYAFDDTSPHHPSARDWLDTQLNGTLSVGLPWESLTAFVRVVTNPRIYRRAATTLIAWQLVQDWLACAVVWVPLPTELHREILGELLALPGIYGNHVHDAHLAALAVEHGLVLCSADRGFARFPRLRWMNPLTG